jgi:hypothetical protein
VVEEVVVEVEAAVEEVVVEVEAAVEEVVVEVEAAVEEVVVEVEAAVEEAVVEVEAEAEAEAQSVPPGYLFHQSVHREIFPVLRHPSVQTENMWRLSLMLTILLMAIQMELKIYLYMTAITKLQQGYPLIHQGTRSVEPAQLLQ